MFFAQIFVEQASVSFDQFCCILTEFRNLPPDNQRRLWDVMVSKAATLLYSVVSPVSRILCNAKMRFFFVCGIVETWLFWLLFDGYRPTQSKRSGAMRQFLARGDSGRSTGYLFGRILRVYYLARTDGHPVAQVTEKELSVKRMFWGNIFILFFHCTQEEWADIL